MIGEMLLEKLVGVQSKNPDYISENVRTIKNQIKIINNSFSISYMQRTGKQRVEETNCLANNLVQQVKISSTHSHFRNKQKSKSLCRLNTKDRQYEMTTPLPFDLQQSMGYIYRQKPP